MTGASSYDRHGRHGRPARGLPLLCGQAARLSWLQHGWCECDNGTVGLLDRGLHLSYELPAYASILFLHGRQQLSNGVSGFLEVSCCKFIDFLLPQTCWQYSFELDPGLQVRRMNKTLIMKAVDVHTTEDHK
ncbi:unnamed protein product [Urochloa humidicola]